MAKAKIIQLDYSGKTMLDRLADSLEKNRQPRHDPAISIPIIEFIRKNNNEST